MIRDLFSDKAFVRKLLLLGLPITLQNFMLALVAAGDAFMLGAYNQESMAAVSLASQIQFVQNILLGTIVTGIGILGAQYWGKGDKVAMGQIFGSSVREALIVSILFFVGCMWFPEILMKVFAKDPVLISIGADYLRIASWSYLLTGLSQCYLGMMRVTDQARRSAWISSTAVLTNIALNAVFIFGLFGAPRMGAKGAALATVLARLIELAWCLISSHQKGFLPLKIREIFCFHRQMVTDFWRYSLPVLGSFALWGIGLTSYTAILGHLGVAAAAANAVVQVFRELMCCFTNGVAGGGSIILGNVLGVGDFEKGKLYAARLSILSIFIGLFCMIISIASIPLASLAVPELSPEAHRYMVGMFLIVSVYIIGRCINTTVINGVFYAGGDASFDFFSLLTTMWGIALPCAFLGAFVFHWNPVLVYGCTCLDEIGKLPWVWVYYRKFRWLRNITRETVS